MNDPFRIVGRRIDRRTLLVGAAAALVAPRPAWGRSVQPVSLDAQSPIAPVDGHLVGLLGDEPGRAHPLLWNVAGALGEAPPAPSEKAGVVVVGGGVSGLATAWLLRDLNPIVLESSSRFGGNAKGETWGDLTYGIGAAYFAYASPKSRLSKAFYRPLSLSSSWRASEGDAFVWNGAVATGFWRGATDPAQAEAFGRVERFLRTTLDDAYPDLPPGEWRVLSDEQLAELDRRSLVEEIERGSGGPLHPHVRTFLDLYGWSAFAASPDEISAASGLNFLCSELEPICAMPGGNGRVAERLLASLRETVPAANLRTGATVVRVEPGADGVVVHWVDDTGPKAIEARAVVMSCPKFVAKHLLPAMPGPQREAIERLTYRAYVVTNVLCNAPCPTDHYELYLLPSDVPTPGARATDVLLGHWAAGGHRERSVLTFYRSIPYDGGRATILDDSVDGVHALRGTATADALSTLPLFGLGEEDVFDVRVARYGHALPVAAKGLVADGTLAAARAPIGGRVFFVEQDNWALPSLETCLVEALDHEGAVRAAVG